MKRSWRWPYFAAVVCECRELVNVTLTFCYLYFVRLLRSWNIPGHCKADELTQLICSLMGKFYLDHIFYWKFSDKKTVRFLTKGKAIREVTRAKIGNVSSFRKVAIACQCKFYNFVSRLESRSKRNCDLISFNFVSTSNPINRSVYDLCKNKQDFPKANRHERDLHKRQYRKDLLLTDIKGVTILLS